MSNTATTATITDLPADAVDNAAARQIAKILVKRVAVQVTVAVVAGVVYHAIENKYFPKNT